MIKMRNEMVKYYDAEMVDKAIEELKAELEYVNVDLKEVDTMELARVAYNQGQLDRLNGKKDNKRRDDIVYEFNNRNDVPSWMEVSDLSRNFGAGMKQAKEELSNILYNRKDG